ncbi:MAG: hypothetical protein NC124_18005 [Clostridium sp.]|nr:hypothetical protein [Clostridium sp.]
MGQEQKTESDLGTKIRKILKSVRSAFGGLVTVVAAVLYVFADKVFDASGVIYKQAIYIVLIGYFLFFLVTLIVTAMFKIRSTKQEIYEDVVSDFRENCEKIDTVTNHICQVNEKLENYTAALAQNIEKERSLITEIEIGQFVLNGKEVIDLEASVGNFEGQIRKCKIYIQSSLFVLEKGPLEDTILWNLRKGVKYIYIIPNGEVYINDYYEMLCDWYRLFSQFLISKDEYERVQAVLNNEGKYKKYWCREYQKIYEEAGKLWNNTGISEKNRMEKIDKYREECKRIFRTLIETHINDENEFFITVAAYEIRRNNWEAIIKLPTQNTNKEYYAFQIPNENNAEMTNFIYKFQSRYKSCDYDPNILSTLGGKMKLDYSRIFN